jgi:hypothetical protein
MFVLMNQNGESKRGLGWGIGLSISLAIVLVLLGFVAGGLGYQTPRLGDNRLTDLGNWGSYLQGTTASFWSLAGVFLIVATFLAQRRQLKDQDDQFEIQNDAVKWQRFESSFFHLLGLHNQVVIAMRCRDPSGFYVPRGQELEGRDCFEYWYMGLKSYFFEMAAKGSDPKPTFLNPMQVESLDVLAKLYLKFYGHHQAEVGHYFRNLYHLFKFVAESKIPDGDKRRYTSLVRAQLSQYELALLFYDALTPIPPEPTNKFKNLIERFGLLENLNLDLLFDKERDVKFYKDTAFK